MRYKCDTELMRMNKRDKETSCLSCRCVEDVRIPQFSTHHTGKKINKNKKIENQAF